MNPRKPSKVLRNINAPPLQSSIVNINPDPMMNSRIPAIHPSQFAFGGMIQPNSSHLPERELMHQTVLPIGQMGPNHHGYMPCVNPILLHQALPHHGQPYFPTPNSNNPLKIPLDYRLIEFNRRLQMRTEECDNLWWDNLITEFFKENATLIITFSDGYYNRYVVNRPIISRYFRSIFDSGCSEFYYSLRSFREYSNDQTVVVDSDSAEMVMTFPKTLLPTTVIVEGRLTMDFDFDDVTRFRNLMFQIRTHREFIIRPIPNLVCNQEEMRREFSTNFTKCGITKHTMDFLKSSSILQTMQEVMSRQKFLERKTLEMQTLQTQQLKTDINRKSNKNIKRKVSNTNSDSSSVRSCIQKPSPLQSSSIPNQSGDYMVVGDPTLMGVEFENGDERIITRLESNQCSEQGNNISSSDLPRSPISSLLPNIKDHNISIILNSNNNGGDNHLQQTSDQDDLMLLSILDDTPIDSLMMSPNARESKPNILKSNIQSHSPYMSDCSEPCKKNSGNEGEVLNKQPGRPLKNGSHSSVTQTTTR